MRSFLFFALFLPLFITAQINRSAREFASEQVQQYVTAKLFKDRTYKPVSFGEIKAVEWKRNSDVAWTIEHKFEITEKDIKTAWDQKPTEPKTYKFLFYLDEKMKVLRADTFSSY